MKTRFFTTLTLVLALLAGFGAATAQGRDEKPARQEIRAYFEANIRPVLRQQRQKLETQLSADDKAQLATYRTQLRDLHQRGKALRQTLPAAPAGARPTLTEDQRQQVHQLRAQARGIMLNVAQLAQKYDAALTKLAQEVQPQKEKWTADLQAIAAKYASAEQRQQLVRFAQHRQRGLGGLDKPVRFLLMDPNAPLTAPGSAPGPAVFPNPTVAATQLEYAVKKAGPVTVELLDNRGITVRTLVQQEQQDKGAHTISANVDDLPAGTYYYKITTRSGTETKRFVKQ